MPNHKTKPTSNVPTSNTAITLVALVITVIVLLILAAVTLNMIIGPNGIIKKTQKAREETEFKTTQEEVELILTEAKTTIISENRELSIPEIAEEIRNTKDKKIEMIIRYMPKAEVEIYKEEVTGQDGVIRTNRPCRNRIQRL